jgi:hypothetical protein
VIVGTIGGEDVENLSVEHVWIVFGLEFPTRLFWLNVKLLAILNKLSPALM